jgi:GNAT superfamily N-acetyltransferase
MHDVIRTATNADAEALASLDRELGYEATAEQMAERLEGVRATGNEEVFVAEKDGEVVAFVHVAAYMTIESGRLGEIRGLVVTERRRSTGVGALLLRKAEEWARARGLKRLRVRTNTIRERAHRFYEREAFVLGKTQRVYDKPL